MKGERTVRWPAAAWFLLLTQVVVALLLLGIAEQRVTAFVDHHHESANDEVRVVADQIIALLAERRRELRLFVETEEPLLDAMVEMPDEPDLYRFVEERLRTFFPDLYGFTLTDRDGRPVVADIGRHFEPACGEALRDTGGALRIHGNGDTRHFDLAVALRNHPAHLLVGFRPGMLRSFLRGARREQHDLALVAADEPTRIEVVADDRPPLEPRVRERELARRPVAGTRWLLLDLGAEGLFETFRSETFRQAGVVLTAVVVASLVMLSLVVRNERRRVAAERALRSANLRLEEQVAERTHELRAAKELAEVTLVSIRDGVITTGLDGIVRSINDAAGAILGARRERFVGRALADLLALADPDSGAAVALPADRALRGDEIVHLCARPWRLQRDGGGVTVEFSAAPICDNGGNEVGAVIVLRDISEAQELARELGWQASHDALTGLINRAEFERRLEQALARAVADGIEHVLLYLDLDQFKVVNDSCGHMAGDELLRQLAKLFHEVTRRSDLIARLGGDEFAVLLEACPRERALHVAETLRQTVRDFRFSWDGKSFVLGVSIGLVAFGDGFRSLAAILSAADSACYAAKEKGRNRIHVHREDDGEIERRFGEMQWVSRIRKAKEEGRFLLYCQRIEPLLGDSVGDHCEILLRMSGEAGEIIPPGAFIPIAERYGLMASLDRMVFRRTLDWFEAHPEIAERFALISINLSAGSLSDGRFVEELLRRLDGSPLDPARFCFEITETATVSNLAHAQQFIRAVRGRGCRFALDDFGSGMSSFAYLKHLKVDLLKIDGEFVRDIVDDPIDRAMVKSIHEIGRAMGLKTVAEYVEGHAIADALREIGVDYAQGYAIDQPHPIDRFLLRDTGPSRERA